MTAEQILSPSHTEPVISLRNPRVSYGEREVLHGINFDVVRGDTLVILGFLNTGCNLFTVEDIFCSAALSVPGCSGSGMHIQLQRDCNAQIRPAGNRGLTQRGPPPASGR
jgi:ABC-type histidine transport system ATPase subunit